MLPETRGCFAPSFWRGFKAGAPLWVAAAPFALAYVVTARDAGLSAAMTQFMSLSVHSAATQIVVIQASMDHTALLTICVTVIVMNMHHILYGFSLKKSLPLTHVKAAFIAFPLTDFVYGAVLAQPRRIRLSFLLGVELSIFLAWNVHTAFAIIFSASLSQLAELHLNFIIPLLFFMLLPSVIRCRLDAAVAAFSAACAVTGYALGWGSIVLPVVSIFAPLFGITLLKASPSKTSR